MGGGHGFFEPMFFLFPFASILFLWYNTINILFLFIACLQYPMYGLFIDKVTLPLEKVKTEYLLLFIHILLAIVAHNTAPEVFK